MGLMVVKVTPADAAPRNMMAYSGVFGLWIAEMEMAKHSLADPET